MRPSDSEDEVSVSTEDSYDQLEITKFNDDFDIAQLEFDDLILYTEEVNNDEEFSKIKERLELLLSENPTLYNRNQWGTNPLHTLAYYGFYNKYQPDFFRILLKYSSSKDINCYDAFGKTPLLEAIEQGNQEAAIQLLQHPEIDPNLFKIEYEEKSDFNLGDHEEKIKSGTSTLKAAQDLGLSEVAQLIENHPKYNPNSEYVNLTSDVLYNYFEHYAACGNVDSLRSFLQQIDLEDFLKPNNGMGWTVLHIACFSGNIEVIDFLLNKEALEKASGQEISDEYFKKFINHRDKAQTVALGRALHVSHSPKIRFPDQARLFINCPQFDPNKTLTFPSQVLLHNLLEMDRKDLIIELAKRKDFDLDLRDGARNTALRIACDNDDVEMVKLLVGIGEMSGIDVNELNKGEAAVMEYLNDYSEEVWFGDTTSQIILSDTGEELTVNDLYRIYDTGYPLTVRVSYDKYFRDSEIEVIEGSSLEDEKIKNHLELALEKLYNNDMAAMPLRLASYPEWYDETLMSEICQKLYGNKEYLHDAEVGESKEISIRGAKIKFTILSEDVDRVEEERVIDAENLDIPNKFNRDDPEKFAAGKFQKSTPFLDPIAERYIEANQKGDLKKSSDLLEIFRTLAFASNSNSAIRNIGIDRIVQGVPQLEEILKEFREKPTQLLGFQNSDQAIDPFSEIFINRIFLANLSRHFVRRKDEVVNRRFDALSRIIFGDARCSAAAFDGENILLSTNLTTEKAKDLVKETMNYFARFAIGSATEQEKISLVKKSTINLILNESKKSEEALGNGLKNLIELVHRNFELVNLKNENLGENGVVDDESFARIKGIAGFAEAIEALEKLKFNEGYIRNTIKYSFRGFRDVAKIEKSIDASSENKEFSKKIFEAFQAGKYLYLNETHPQEEGVHAEMRVADYFLSKGNLGKEKYYIGLPKLCCAHCNLMLSNLENFSIDSEAFTRGKHTEIFTWPIPNFLRKNFSTVFGDDKELCEAFGKAEDPFKLVEECFSKESMQMRILKGQFGRTNQDLDLSTSVPTFVHDYLVNQNARKANYVLSDEVREKLLLSLKDEQLEEVLKQAERTRIKNILFDRTIRKDALENFKISPKLKKEFLPKRAKFFIITENLDLSSDLEEIKKQLKTDKISKESEIDKINSKEGLEKFIDAKIADFNKDVEAILSKETEEKFDISCLKSDLTKLIYNEGTTALIPQQQLFQYLDDLHLNEEQKALWTTSYEIVAAEIKKNLHSQNSSEEKSENKEPFAAASSKLSKSKNANQTLDAFNYVRDRSNLTHQNLNVLLKHTFQKSGLNEEQYDALSSSGSVTTAVIGNQIDNDLRDSILRFIGQEPPSDRASFALCRGYLRGGQLEGNTHWTALHLRRSVDENGRVIIRSYHADSMSNEIPQEVTRILTNLPNTKLEDLDDEARASIPNQRAISRLANISFEPCQSVICENQPDGYSCGDRSVFNILRMHNGDNLESLQLTGNAITQDGQETTLEQFITSGRSYLKGIFNGVVDDRRERKKSEIGKEDYTDSDLMLATVESIVIDDQKSEIDKMRQLILLDGKIRHAAMHSSSEQIIITLSKINFENFFERIVDDFINKITLEIHNLSEQQISAIDYISSISNFQNPQEILRDLESFINPKASENDLSDINFDEKTEITRPPSPSPQQRQETKATKFLDKTTCVRIG